MALIVMDMRSLNLLGLERTATPLVLLRAVLLRLREIIPINEVVVIVAIVTNDIGTS
jgi:hypothetical protein